MKPIMVNLLIVIVGATIIGYIAPDNAISTLGGGAWGLFCAIVIYPELKKKYND